jgi:hypothetical protein
MALKAVSTSLESQRSEVMTRMGKTMMLGAALVLAACGGKDGVEDTEYVEATPDLSGTALEINSSA